MVITSRDVALIAQFGAFEQLPSVTSKRYILVPFFIARYVAFQKRANFFVYTFSTFASATVPTSLVYNEYTSRQLVTKKRKKKQKKKNLTAEGNKGKFTDEKKTRLKKIEWTEMGFEASERSFLCNPELIYIIIPAAIKNVCVCLQGL